MTPREAKKIVEAALASRNVQCTLLAKTVSFSDLARADCVFVTVVGYPFDGEHGSHTTYWHEELKPLAVKHGFRIKT